MIYNVVSMYGALILAQLTTGAPAVILTVVAVGHALLLVYEAITEWRNN